MIWRPGIFLITIMAVTPSGRAVAERCVNFTISSVLAQSPFSFVALAMMALIAVVCLLMLHEWRWEKPGVYFVWHEVRYDGAKEGPEPIRTVRRYRGKLRLAQQSFFRFRNSLGE